LFVAVVEAVEEAALDALCVADTVTGFRGHTAEGLPLG
jgi:L-aminopeptidase/D-esterase-like protein